MKPIVMMTQTHTYQDERVVIQHIPLIKTVRLSLNMEMCQDHYDWLIFTSKNAVKYFAHYLDQLDFDKVAVIGEKTKAYCDSIGIEVHFCPKDFSQEGLLASHPFQKHDKVLIPSSRRARALLPETLKAQGIFVHKIDLYDVQVDDNAVENVLRELKDKQFDAMTFASSSAVHAFFKQQPPKLNDFYFAIGQQTLQTIRDYGYEATVADQQTLESMITKIIEKRS